MMTSDVNNVNENYSKQSNELYNKPYKRGNSIRVSNVSDSSFSFVRDDSIVNNDNNLKLKKRRIRS